jgi:hypothetical protein
MARGQYRESRLNIINEATTRDGRPDWRAAAWLLERIFPEDYGRRRPQPSKSGDWREAARAFDRSRADAARDDQSCDDSYDSDSCFDPSSSFDPDFEESEAFNVPAPASKTSETLRRSAWRADESAMPARSACPSAPSSAHSVAPSVAPSVPARQVPLNGPSETSETPAEPASAASSSPVRQLPRKQRRREAHLARRAANKAACAARRCAASAVEANVAQTAPSFDLVAA